MAKSRFEYVRNYEMPDPLMPNAFIVVRIDGRGFHKFSDAHGFQKPNDPRALHLMDKAAQTVMNEFKDIVLAFGESDEYSFLLRRSTKLYNRRRSKINSAIVSLFTSAYVFHYTSYLSSQLLYPPSFDSRVVLYPSEKEVRDYFSWRQADTHINNLYNTAFWALVKGGQTTTEANRSLQGSDSKDKNELLFSQFGINYNSLPAMYRKGSICIRIPPQSSLQTSVPSAAESGEAGLPNLVDDSISVHNNTEDASTEKRSALPTSTSLSDTTPGLDNGTSRAIEELLLQDTNPRYGQVKGSKSKAKRIKPYEGIEGEVVVLHEDMIGDGFWEQRPWLLL